MSLYRVGDTYYLDLQTPEGRLRRSTGTTDKKQAQEYHDSLRAQLWRQEKLGEKPLVTWFQAVKLWTEYKPRNSADLYRLRSMSLEDDAVLPFTKDRIELELSGMGSGTFNRALALIVSIHNLSGVDPPKVKRQREPKGRTRWLTAEEWARLQKVLKEESELLWQAARFAISTGLRENNVLELEWEQVDRKRRQVVIYGDQMKQGTTLGVPLPDAAMAVLDERRGLHKQWVFAHQDSQEPLYKASNRAWYNALKKAKLYKTGVTWHTLRHTWASWHVMNGTSLEELMKLGGWASYSMVLRYAHMATGHLAAVAEQAKPVSKRYNAPRKPKS